MTTRQQPMLPMNCFHFFVAIANAESLHRGAGAGAGAGAGGCPRLLRGSKVKFNENAITFGKGDSRTYAINENCVWRAIKTRARDSEHSLTRTLSIWQTTHRYYLKDARPKVCHTIFFN